MEQTGVQKLAGVLKILVTITFLCNLIVMPLVPLLVWMGQSSATLLAQFYAAATPSRWIAAICKGAVTVWSTGYTAVLAAFLLFCGSCTAVILWQARRVLTTIVAQDTFTFGNAKSTKIAALCCFLIALAALLRTIWGFCVYRSPAPLLTYNALFCPVFLMAGLLCLVMSALFRQAAELKAENDLTI